MSDDLAKRLRYAADRAKKEYPEVFRVSEEIAYEAADRIEKLEAALAHIYAWYPISVSGPIQTIHEIRDYARKALEGKDE